MIVPQLPILSVAISRGQKCQQPRYHATTKCRNSNLRQGADVREMVSGTVGCVGREYDGSMETEPYWFRHYSFLQYPHAPLLVS